MEVTVDYCQECGHLDKAVETSETVLRKFSGQIDKLELVPGEDGVFRVTVESEVVFDLEDQGYSPQKIEKIVGEKIQESGE